MSGQIPGRVPNQAGPSLAGLSQQNGNSISTQLQSVGGHRATLNMDPDFVIKRQNIQKMIYKFLLQRQHQPQTIPPKKVMDIVRRLEEGLFKSANTKEEYLNLETLENRLQVLIRRIPFSSHNQQLQQHVNSSSTIGTMIPTPGMPQSGNSNLMSTSSVDNSMIPSSGYNSIASSTINTGSFLPTATGAIHSGSFNSSNGPFTDGYQQSPSNFSISSGANSMVSSTGVQRMTSQMIPTPGFNNINNNNINNNNSQSYLNLDSSSNGVGFSGVESMVSQPLQQKQHVGGQNSRMLHSLGSHVGGGIRSGLQQKSYAFSNGTLNGGLGMMGTNSPVMNGPGTSEGYLTAPLYGNSSAPLQQHFDQHQRQMLQGDGYGSSTADSSGSGSFHSPLTSGGLMMNNQDINSAANVKASIDQSEKMNFQSPHSLRENLVQSHLQQQFEQQPHHFQPQLVQQQRLQKQPSQQRQLSLKNDAFGQSLVQSDLVSQIKLEPGMEHHDEALRPQVSEQFNSSEILALQPGPQDICSSLAQTSQQMEQLLHHHQFVADSQNDFNHPIGVQSEAAHLGQWHPRSQDGSHMPGVMSHEQDVQEEFRHRLTGQDEAQRNNFSSEGSIISQAVTTRIAASPNYTGTMCTSGTLNRELDFRNQQRWLLFLRHARSCKYPEGKCPINCCIDAQKLWRHVERCNVAQCPHLRCDSTKALLKHQRECRNPSCPVCIPVRNFIKMQSKTITLPESNSALPCSVNRSCKSHDSGDASGRLASKMSPLVIEMSEDLHPSMKRMKIEPHSQSIPPQSESSAMPVPAISESHVLQDVQLEEHQHGGICMPMKSEVTVVKMEIPLSSAQASPMGIVTKKDTMDDTYIQRSDSDVIISNAPAGFPKEERLKIEKEVDQGKQENVSLTSENTSGTKSGKPKIKGVSLMELFTPEQVREHITGLRRWVGQSKAKAEKNQAMEHSMSENSCQLCAVEKLTFEPPPIYCTPCGARIKRNAMYYTIGTGDTRHFFCIPCYNEARGDTILVDTTAIPKARLEKKKNDEETEEWWVQCDKCEAWQHQICALFNGRRNDGGQAEYTCPNCYIEEVERGERTPLPQSAVLGAKDLPRTILSDHIEQRLFRRLKQERTERARVSGKSYDEVPGAESLVIRVVSSVDKKLEVKQRFLEIFQEENYPTEFAYKSKVVLLFQKIEGVEVCLFGMYVQEFGSECQQPNHRRVYLSYLDSVKYFRPEIRAVTGEALRTFVYHEILIGYLEYCKKRGFTSCYIWACPPLKGEDYILYCHPEIQKTPKSDKLREWYLSMLRKAMKENIVAELTNLYDHFFVTSGECKAKVTAARLPYFDGDYWPGAAEDIIYQIRQEEDGRKLHKKGTTKKIITKRALKASGQSDLSGNASKDVLLMHKLGESISPMKEDFIMVHLQHSCTHCCILMVSGNRWVCNQCKNFQLCDKCYEAEQQLEERERHPINHRDKHALHPVEINNVAGDTKDKDEILESEFFDTRQAFLSLCQGNHYQYDTLRRAKHSSMMVLYHLHNPTAPAFVTTCNICHLDIESGQGWRCEICPDYDVCNACFQKDGGIDHPHKLTNHPSLAERDAQNKEARQLRVVQLRKMLDLLVHASQCRSPQCLYPNCRKVKGLFRHGIQCKTRASGGCVLCKKMWYLLQLHSRACKESECHVPRCRDLREHLRRLQQQSDSRRRAAVMEMMRQRAAEVASGGAV
ncbi:hypothetical protein LguiA_018588 [Lonicera macranthoides]